jgi:hypothetical protein
MHKVLVIVLFVIPFAAQLVVLPWVNHIHPIILGLPFLHFWLLMWMILTPLFTYAIYVIQKKAGSLDECTEI